MKKYKELDVKAIDPSKIAQTIRPGDVITIIGPKKRDKAVREVAANKTVTIGKYDVTMNFLMTEPGVSITKIERPIPEVELPTVPGYYESARYPLKGGYFALRLNAYGEWYRDGVRKTEEQMREHMPLTRLVPETEVSHLDARNSSRELKCNRCVECWLRRSTYENLNYPLSLHNNLSNHSYTPTKKCY